MAFCTKNRKKNPKIHMEKQKTPPIVIAIPNKKNNGKASQCLTANYPAEP
jgi:hypothetical protein